MVMTVINEKLGDEITESFLDDVLPPLADEPADELPGSDPPSPRLEALLEEIAEAEMLCQNAEEAVNEAKVVLKEAKAEYDGCVLKLRRLAKAVRNDEDRPLFNQIKESGEDDGDYTALLTESIDVLKLPASVVSKLAEEHVQTIGDLEQLREDITLGRKKWPKGIGPAKVDLIETVVVEWLADNCTDGTAEPDDEDDVDDTDE